MGRPVASEDNKKLGVAFARAVSGPRAARVCVGCNEVRRCCVRARASAAGSPWVPIMLPFDDCLPEPGSGRGVRLSVRGAERSATPVDQQCTICMPLGVRWASPMCTRARARNVPAPHKSRGSVLARSRRSASAT